MLKRSSVDLRNYTSQGLISIPFRGYYLRIIIPNIGGSDLFELALFSKHATVLVLIAFSTNIQPGFQRGSK